MSKMRCPKCGEPQSNRVKRHGLAQKLLLPLFGYFPWECASCRFQHLSHERGLRRRARRQTPKPVHPEPGN